MSLSSLTSMQDLFTLQCLLESIEIRLCCRRECGLKQLLAIVTEDDEIVLYYTYGELPSVIKRLPWFSNKSQFIQAICLDPTATWLLVISDDSSLFIVPALSLVDRKQRVDCKWSISDVTHLTKHVQTPGSKPLSVVWWQTWDCNQNALIGYEDGTIGLFSLTDGRCLATCSVSDKIVKLYLCQDNSLDCVSLLVNGESGQQWRLILEQHSIGFIWGTETNSATTDTSVSSRLQNLKQMGVEKFASLKQRFTDVKNSRRDSQASDTASESSLSDSSHSGLELLPHICDTFFAPQYAKNRYLFSAFYRPTSILTIHAVDIESAPLYIHKLCPKISSLLLTNSLIYAINEDLDALIVISTQLSECKMDANQEFNLESLIAKFKFSKKDEKILNVYKLTDQSCFNDTNYKKESNGKLPTLATSVDQLRLRKPKIDACVIVTNSGIYKIVLSCSVINKFISLVLDEVNYEKAEKLAIVFGLNLQQLLESCGDLMIAQSFYHQGLILYKQAKVHLLKRVLKVAISGDSRALLKFVHLCLSASKIDMSTATKIHMGNLAIMAYTELILRHNGHFRVNNTKDFINFLRYEEFYDQILAVTVACQSGHWNIVALLATARGLQNEVVAALSQIIQLSNAPPVTNHDFVTTLSEPSLTQSLLIQPQFCKVILRYIRVNVENFPISVLQRFVNQLDPSRADALPIVRHLFQHKRRFSTSLDSVMLDSVNDSDYFDQVLINAKDMIETLILVMIHLVNKTDNHEYDINLLQNVETVGKVLDYPILNKFPNFSPLSCGYEHAAVIRNGAVYTMGRSNSGCLGFGPILTQSSSSKIVHTLAELKLKVLSVSCGRKHSLALTDCGVYTWGSNAYGQLGISLSNQESPYPQIVKNLSDKQIVDVAAGQYHSMALTASGLVYTWGWGIHGQLGHGNSNSEWVPKLLHFKHTIVQISAGHAHSLILTTEGRLYGFGSNAFGQLSSNTLEGNKTTSPIWISLLPDIYIPIKKIASAYFHNIAVRADEAVYTWGATPQEVRLLQSKFSKKSGETGGKPFEPWKVPVCIYNGTEKDPIDQIAVGFRHSAILHCGKLYLCKNMNDEVTMPKFNEEDNVGTANQKFIHVSCGPDFTIAMDQTGRLLAWGNNALAQTLLGKPHDDNHKHVDGQMVLMKNTKRIIKLSNKSQLFSEAYPIEIPGLPTMAITFNPPDHQLLISQRNANANSIISIENDESVKVSDYNYRFGQKTLHYILETYFGYYDVENAIFKCLQVNNLQAAGKIAILNGQFGDSLGYQLAAFKSYIDSCKLDFTTLNLVSKAEEEIDSNKHFDFYEMNKSNSSPCYFLSSSSSLDSIQHFNDDLEGQGGRESPCNVLDLGQSISHYVQSVKTDVSSQISSVSKLVESPSRNLRNQMNECGNSVFKIKDFKTREVVQMLSKLIEFYIKRTYSSENHILMQNILIKCIEFWLNNNLPVTILESILLKNMDKHFYPLSILLFCKNFNNNLEQEIVKKDDDEELKCKKPSNFLKQFSTKFCLQLCSMVVENVSKA